MVELGEARKTAAKIGLGLQYVLKEARIFDILTKLSPVMLSKEISTKVTIICKGGTVLNKVFFKGTQRFSEDIDFDAFFVEKLDRRQKLAFLDKNILSFLKESYQIERPRLMKEVARFTCTFINETGAKDSVFVEFNLEPKGLLSFKIEEAKSEILDIPSVQIPVYSFPVIVAKKIKTFYERGSGKDLYDIFYGLEIVEDIEEIVDALKKVLKSEDIEYNEFVNEFMRKLEDKRSIARVHASTNPYIPRKLRVDWVETAIKLEDKLRPYL